MDKIYKGFGWVLIYICMFGLSDFYVKNYVKTSKDFILYYIFIGFLGFMTIFR